MQSKLHEEQSEEGNYSRTVSLTESLRVRRNNTNGGIKKDGCKYKYFMASKTPSLSGNPTPVEVIDWIYEIEMVFESYDSSNRQKTIIAIRQLKSGVLR